MYCIIKSIVQGKQARVKKERKSASPVLNALRQSFVIESSEFREGEDIFGFSKSVQFFWHSLSCLFDWYRGHFTRGLEAEKSHSSSVKFKNAWSYYSTSPVCLHSLYTRTVPYSIGYSRTAFCNN